MDFNPKRVLKQSFIDEWLRQRRVHEDEAWHPDHSSLDVVKDRPLYQIARQLIVKVSNGEAIESGQHDLETIGPRWWESSDYYAFASRLSPLDSFPQNYGKDWWKITTTGWGWWKKSHVPRWQYWEFERQMNMLRYAKEHLFSHGEGDCHVVRSEAEVWQTLEHQLDWFAFDLTDNRNLDWGFAVPWDYRHFAQCIVANLQGKPYLYHKL